MSRAYYNEIDPYAAQWLRNLIAAGHIAPGDVDERSIEDVLPDELLGYTQCHFFAGLGAWSYALRRAGWPDDRPVWTGSCPCQPFSSAGKGAGFADERHLWPAWLHLIQQRRPPVVLGEQVASHDGLGWLDLVQADLEATDYTCGAADLCAAGVGAPNIRQRLWFVAYANRTGLQPRGQGCPALGYRQALEPDRSAEWLADAGPGRRPGIGWAGKARAAQSRQTGKLSDLNRQRVRTTGSTADDVAASGFGGRARQQELQPLAGHGSELGDTNGTRLAIRQDTTDEPGALRLFGPAFGEAEPVRGFWGGADWIWCRDGKYRPVEPGAFPLVDGAAARVGRLRAYGNAINAEAARYVIQAAMSALLVPMAP